MMIQNWSKHLDDGSEVCSVFFDVRKAFDSVPHCHLLNILSKLQLDPHILHWILSYLADRSQVVAVSGVQSSPVNVVSAWCTTRISFGSPTLYHLCWWCCTSNLINKLHLITCRWYCSLLLHPLSHWLCSVAIRHHGNFYLDWRGKLSEITPDRCRLMFLSRKRTHFITPSPFCINKGSQIQSTDSVKYLGILLTSDLTWSTHIAAICAKIRKLVDLLYGRFQNCSPNVKLTLYKAFIRPHVEYASQVWDRHLLKDVDLLEKDQKFALRVCCKYWSTHYSDLLGSAHISTLVQRCRKAKLTHLYKIVFGLTDCETASVKERVLKYGTKKVNLIQLQELDAHSWQFTCKYSFSLTLFLFGRNCL